MARSASSRRSRPPQVSNAPELPELVLIAATLLNLPASALLFAAMLWAWRQPPPPADAAAFWPLALVSLAGIVGLLSLGGVAGALGLWRFRGAKTRWLHFSLLWNGGVLLALLILAMSGFQL